MAEEANGRVRVPCPLGGCREYHDVLVDRNGRKYLSCRDWGTSVWFERGPKGEAYWRRFVPTGIVCPGCGRTAQPDPDAGCPDCGEPWPPCPVCWRLQTIGELYCPGCGSDGERFRLDAQGNPLPRKDLPEG